MSHKQTILFSLLAIASIFSGLTFGLLDIFGFIDGRHTISFSLLGISALLLYISLVTVFILNIGHNNRIYSLLLLVSVFFSITFFFMNLNPFLTILAGVSYFYLLIYTFRSVTKRFGLYIKFSPNEIFLPVLKQSLLYVLIILSLIAYAQSQRLLSQNSLVSPTIAKTFFRPVVTVMNQQVNAQIKSDFGEALAKLPPPEREKAVALILRKTVENMADKQTHTIYDIPVAHVPIEKASIKSDGTIDLDPVFNGMLPSIAQVLNARLNKHALLAPLVIAVLTFLIFQPLSFPLQWMEGLITIIIFKILIRTKFIKIRTETHEVEQLTL